MNYITKKQIKHLDLNLFIEVYFYELQGAAIFCKNDKSKVSKIVSNCCKKQISSNFNNFIPSHIASCFKNDDEKLYLLDIKPPKSTIQPLYEYLENTKDEYIIFLRKEKINLKKYNEYMKARIGLWYGLVSAVQSIFKKITFKHGMHCSENYIYAYNQQGYYYDINANKSTPANLLAYLANKYKN